MKVDVVMITKNASTHSSIFPLVLRRLYNEVPVNKLIIVDDFSVDNTLEIINQYPNTEVHQVHSNRAEARQYGIQQVSTEWFMFLDDDAILRKNWFKIAEKYMNEDVGLIWGWDIIANRHSRNRMKVMYYLRKKSEYELMVKNFRHRGGTHDTLIRTNIVRDIHIPSDLNVYEDWYIKKHIENKGYKAVTPEDLYCYHFLNPHFNLQLGRELAVLHKKYGLQSRAIALRNFIFAPFKSLTILTLTGDLQASVDQLKFYSFVFLGEFLK